MTATSSPRPSDLGDRAVATLTRRLSAEDLARFRAAVRSIDGSPAAETRAGASPVHAFVLAHDAFGAAFEAVGAVRPNGGEPSRVHLSQEIRSYRLPQAGEQITADVRVLGARRDARGVRVAVRAVLTDAAGARLAEMATGALLGGAVIPEPFGDVPPFPAHRSDGDTTTVTTRVTAEGVRRYAEVSGDRNPIHVDDDAARSAGFDGAIAHGMGVLAMVSEMVIDRYADGDPGRVREIGVRFSSPVTPGEPLHVALQPAAGIVCFTCRSARGLALKGGWVAIGASSGPAPAGPGSGDS